MAFNNTMDEHERMVTDSDESSIGEAVSGRAPNVYNEEEVEDEFYIPPRRPSLDLGPPMEINQWRFSRPVIVEKASSPVQSYGTMKSEEETFSLDEEDEPSTRVQLTREDSFSSCHSFDSDDLEKEETNITSTDDTISGTVNTPGFTPEQNVTPHPSLTVAFTFKAICDTLRKLSKGDVKTFKLLLWKRYPQAFSSPPLSMDLVDLVDCLFESYNQEVAMQITQFILQEMGHKKAVEKLKTLCIRNEVRHDLCEILRSTYGQVCEESAAQGEGKALDDVFTQLSIVSTCDNGPNIEHEVMQIEKMDSNRKEGRRISTADFLSTDVLAQSNVRLTLVSGAAGSGKSTAVRRLILDWVEGRSHTHVSFLFPVPFRELGRFQGSQISLLDIVHALYPMTRKLREEDFKSDDCKIMFVCDGLHEYRGKMDFQNTELHVDHAQATSLEVLVVNLLRGRLLYRGLFLLTSRPQMKNCVPWDTCHNNAEVRGFCEPEKDEYFKRRFPDPDRAAQVIGYVNSVRTLRIMCHLPLFCSLVADEHERAFRERGARAELPGGITYMFTRLLLALTGQHRGLDKQRDFLMKLGHLAFQMLEKKQFTITWAEWKGFGVDEEEAVINTGLCMQYTITPFVLIQEKVLSFIHPSVQEYLAALYVFLCFRNQGDNKIENTRRNLLAKLVAPKVTELYKSAVDKSLACDDGKLDIFLRFLLGMAKKVNLELLQPLCTSAPEWPTVIEDAAALLREKLKLNLHPDRKSNFERCLEELGVHGSEAASS